MAIKNQWKGIEELEQSSAFVATSEKEFREELPLEVFADEKFTSKHAGRRDFLKLLGFSVGAATIAACRIPVNKAIPYVFKPEEITPGVANYYASTFYDGSDYCSVLVKVRDGRPIKIEGNDNSHVTNGGTSARAQGSILSLYDQTRAQHPTKGGKEIKWEDADKEIRNQLAEIRDAKGQIRILSSTIYSPSTKQLIADFSDEKHFPTTKHVVYDAISRSAMITANDKSFGVKGIPSYNFKDAKVIVGFACDFLGTWVSPIEFARDYANGRRNFSSMSRHYHFESNMSLTGSNADRRYAVKPSLMGSALVALYNKITGSSLPTGKLNDKTAKGIDKVAMDLIAAKGSSLVVCGVNDENMQLMTNAINNELKNYGTTINFTRTSNANAGIDADMKQLVDDMKGGNISALIILNANPAYDYFNSKDFVDGLKNVKLSISCNDRLDETSSLCTFSCPDNHYLESWNDAEPKMGMYSVTQPTISPLYHTRQVGDSLLNWMGSSEDYYSYMKGLWLKYGFPGQKMFKTFQEMWDNSVKFGVAEMEVKEFKDYKFNVKNLNEVGGVLTAIADMNKGMDLVLYEKIGMGNGRYANNPWLQELPDPVSKVTWDNYACINPETAKTMGIIDGDWVKVSIKGQNTRLVRGNEVEGVYQANDYSVELPVVVQPGQNKDTIAIALGYGRTKGGRAADGVGVNAFPFISYNGNNFIYSATGVTVSATGKQEKLAQTQTHHTIEGREIAKEWSLTEFFGHEIEEHAAERDMEDLKNDAITMYPEYSYPGLRWGMSIDLNSCTGCGACVIGCQSENNVPVVGKTEVMRVHEMAWLRIDRYYSFAGKDGHQVDKETNSTSIGMADKYRNVADWEDVEVIYQPMLCQHCENAPCENVCPVAATNHSTEGLNQMAYNRCIGTRYCANNCPYKVRRFNWFDYTGADSFPWNLHDDAKMTDPVTRMVLNPDVTVRSRGVMEKCSFCVQKIQLGKLAAKKEDRKLLHNEVKTACQTACPTSSIVFGNVNDAESEVKKLKADKRTYFVLEEIHTQPSIGYMAKIRNFEHEESKA